MHTLKTLKDYIASELDTRARRVKGLAEEAWAFDLFCCDFSISYLRQELRRMGYATKSTGKNSRWLLVYKK